MENQLSGTIRNALKEKTFTFRGVQLHDVQVKRFRTPMTVVATVLSSNQSITTHQVRLVQDFLTKEIGAPIEFRLRIIPSTELTAIELPSEPEEKKAVPPAKDIQGPVLTSDQAPMNQNEPSHIDQTGEQHSLPVPDNTLETEPAPAMPESKPLEAE
ncbi:MAG: hypothetical protein HC888_02105 [Candidatus Competibacteraceae bacterium]|nr:hypothetical protein [Candidatus Competibacteraceae bacterium]